MPTILIFTVGTAGRDYATLPLALADLPAQIGSASLVAADVQVFFLCYNDSVFTSRFTVSGFTTDATRNIVIQAAAGQGHTRVANTGVHIEPTSGTGHVATILDNYISLIDLEMFQQVTAGGSDEVVRMGNSTNNIEGFVAKNNLCRGSLVSNCDVFYAGDWDLGTLANPIQLLNNVIWGAQRCGIFFQNFSGVHSQFALIVSNTIADCGSNLGFDCQSGASTLDMVIVNLISFNSVVRDYGATAAGLGTVTTTGSSNNYDERSQVPAPGGINPFVATDNPAPGPGTWGIFYDLTNYNDLGLQDLPGVNALIDQGVGPTANPVVPPEDCVNVARGALVCEPGAFEIEEVPPPAAGGYTDLMNCGDCRCI